MSLLQSPRRPSSDDLDSSADLHVGLDRELDLSAERPQGRFGERGRGPGLLVAAIVVSSLALAGAIVLVRGKANETAASEPTSPAPRREILAAPTEPVSPPGPITEPTPAVGPGPAPSRVAAHQVSAVVEPVAAAPVEVEPAPVDPAVSPAAAVPAAIAAPSARVPTQPSPLEPARGEADEPGLALPAPVFDDPEPEPTPTPTGDANDPLPGVEEPSIFAPDDADADADEPDEDRAIPSSSAVHDLDDAPVEARNDVPVEARDDAPVEARDDAPVEARDDAPVEARDDAPVEARDAAPDDDRALDAPAA